MKRYSLGDSQTYRFIITQRDTHTGRGTNALTHSLTYIRTHKSTEGRTERGTEAQMRMKRGTETKIRRYADM